MNVQGKRGQLSHANGARAILIAKERQQRAAWRVRVARDDLNFSTPRAALL